MERKYSIGDISFFCKIPIRTLRYYDKISLFKPEYRDNKTNYRYYSKRQIKTLHAISFFRFLGFSFNNIKQLLSNTDLTHLQKQLEHQSKTLASEIKLLQGKKQICDWTLERVCRSIHVLSKSQERHTDLNEIRLEAIPCSKMLYTRTTVPKYVNSDINMDLWFDILNTCSKQNIIPQSPVIMTCYNPILEQFLIKDADIEFGVLIKPEELPPHDNTVNIKEWGGFQAITTYYFGQYSEIMARHVELIQWANQHDYEISGPASEVFLISHLDTDQDNVKLLKLILPVTMKK